MPPSPFSRTCKFQIFVLCCVSSSRSQPRQSSKVRPPPSAFLRSLLMSFEASPSAQSRHLLSPELRVARSVIGG
ncbi:hypothetical protein V2J09_009277 [Rumex salicifolius]